MSMTQTTTDLRWPSLAEIKGDLEGTAYFRDQRANRFPDDLRNVEAERICNRLAQDIDQLEGSSTLTALRDAIEGLGDDEEPFCEFVRLSGDYRKGIGFNSYPATIFDYAVALEEIASQSVRLLSTGEAA